MKHCWHGTRILNSEQRKHVPDRIDSSYLIKINLSTPDAFMHTNRFPHARLIDGMFWTALTVYLAVLHVENVIALRNLAFFLMLLSTIFLLVNTKQRPVFPFWFPWIAYTAVALISVTYSVDPAYSLRNIRSELGYGALLLIVCATWSRWSPTFNGLLLVLIAVNGFLEIAAYSFASFGDPMIKIVAPPPIASAGLNSNFLVSALPLMALSIWWFWRKKQFAFSFAAAILIVTNLGALVMSYNRQSFVAVLASIFCAGVLILWYQFSWRRLAVFSALILLIVSLLGIQLVRRAENENIDKKEAATVFTTDVRWGLWKFSFDKIEKKPMSGSGFGRETFGKAYPEVLAISPDMFLWHAHNMVINKGVQMGIPGMLAFLLLWFAILREFGRHLGTSVARHAIAVAILSVATAVFLKNMTDDHFLRDPAYLFWLLVGITVGSLRRLENEEVLGKC
jgi:O-antigen ligase